MREAEEKGQLRYDLAPEKKHRRTNLSDVIQVDGQVVPTLITNGLLQQEKKQMVALETAP